MSESSTIDKLLASAQAGDAEAQYILGHAYLNGEGLEKDFHKGFQWLQDAALSGNGLARSAIGQCVSELEGTSEFAGQQFSYCGGQADEGNIHAQVILGLMYELGFGTTKNPKFAAELYRQAVEKGDPGALNNFGRIHSNGIGVEKDQRLAVEWYRKAADLGDASAQNNLGSAYDKGRGVEQDDELAVEWYRKAAKQGHASAQYSLGWAYDNGQGVEQDDELAVEWYRKAAKQGHASAQYSLGWAYDNGQGVEQDDELAVEWYRKAAKQGHASAQYSLGWAYDNGQGVEQDDELAVEWYRKAAERGNASAQYSLGWAYNNGQGVEQDDELAVEWYRKAAKRGNADAQCNLGWSYDKGRGVEQDDQLAVEWYRKAAEQDLARAQFSLGVFYRNGRGVEQDDQLAVEWYRKAAERGNASAQYSLGWAYRNGKGVEQDDELAVEWYRKAAKRGNADAQCNLGWSYDKGRGVEQDDQLAVEWYRKAAEQDLARAQFSLGVFYRNGRGVEQDDQLAVEWYRKAAERGHEGAKKNLKLLLETPLKDRIRNRKRKTNERRCQPLLDASTPELYRKNAFRITGLLVDATPREVKRRIDDLKYAEEMGDAEDEHGHAYALDPLPTIEQITEAAQSLKNPEQRIIEEFFWFWPNQWGEGKKDPAIVALLQGDENKVFDLWNDALSKDQGRAGIVAKHNLALIYQLVALDSERQALEGDIDPEQQEEISKYWRSCFKYWEELTDDEDFWSLITERIRMLDDPRLTTGFARRMRATLPEAMDKVNALQAIAFIEQDKHELAVQHIEYMLETHQGQDDVAGTMALVAEPLIKRIRVGIDHAEKSRQGASSSAHTAAVNLLHMADEPIRILKRFLPEKDPQLLDICDAIADACLNCIRAILRDDKKTEAQCGQAIALVEKAIPFAYSDSISKELDQALKDADLGKVLSNPKVKKISNLAERALSESLKKQLNTLGQEIGNELVDLYSEVGGQSVEYQTAVDLVAKIFRTISVDLINRGQEQITRIFEVLGDENKRRLIMLAAQSGDSRALAFEKQKWDALIEVAIGIEFYDRGRKLAYSSELKKKFEEDVATLNSLRDLCKQMASEIYTERKDAGLLLLGVLNNPNRRLYLKQRRHHLLPTVDVLWQLQFTALMITRLFKCYASSGMKNYSAIRGAGYLLKFYYRIGPGLATSIGHNQFAVSRVRQILDWIVRKIKKTRQYRQFVLQQDEEGAYGNKEA